MPCHDHYPSDYEQRQSERISRLETQLSESGAVLCQVMQFLEQPTKDGIPMLDQFKKFYNEEEAGVPLKRLTRWWSRHQERDRKRKAQEAAEEERKRLRKAGIEKLSPAERLALGLPNPKTINEDDGWEK